LELLNANLVDPVTAAVGDHLVVYEVDGNTAKIIAQGVKVNCDGQMLVLGILPDEYERAGGAIILGTGGTVDVEPDDKTENSVSLEGRRVASGDAYKRWNEARSRRR